MVAYKLKPSKGRGTEMIRYFNKLLKPKSISAIGINFKVAKSSSSKSFRLKWINVSVLPLLPSRSCPLPPNHRGE